MPQASERRQPTVSPPTILLLIGIAVFCLHAALLGSWLIDDAGISFAYARNLAGGHGLVSQPGLAPVEGFSNPLWTLLLSALFAARLFAVPWSVKVLSGVLVVASFLVMASVARGHAAAPTLATLPVLLLALNTSFVVWTVSGLENPLLAALVVSLAWLTMKAPDTVHAIRCDLAAGVLAGALALTRPDGAIYAVAYPLVLLFTGAWAWRGLGARVIRYGLAAGVPACGYEIFRWRYFGDVVPNTFHAKVQPFLLAFGPGRIAELVSSAAGWTTPVAVGVIVVAGIVLLRRRAVGAKAVTLAIYLALSAGVYWLMPPDWMGEYRFATAFFIFFYWVLAESLAVLVGSLGERRALVRWAPLAVAFFVLSADVHAHAVRSMGFARNPTVPFSRIVEFGRGYDALARQTGAASPSLLAPDLGGTLFEARHLRIYDLAGLCDRIVARTLMRDRHAFHAYVFEVARPTFIHVHGTWSGWAALHMDARFARDYVPLHEEWRAPRGAQDGTGGEPWVGDYVRRDALTSDADLEYLRSAFQGLGLDRPLP